MRVKKDGRKEGERARERAVNLSTGVSPYGRMVPKASQAITSPRNVVPGRNHAASSSLPLLQRFAISDI